jgi:HK97 family phage prohead protease/HK97 family phage major capsid protein
MPIRKPKKDETQSEFMHDCVSELMQDGKRPQDQCVAICLSTWRDAKGEPEPKDKAAALSVQPPKKGEDFKTFLARCVPDAMKDPDVTEERATDQCSIVWEESQVHGNPVGLHGNPRARHKQEFGPDDDYRIRPEEGESEDDFYDRCLQDLPEETCELIWDNYGNGGGGEDDMEERKIDPKKVLQKTHVGEVNGAEYVLSDDTPDRMGDIIEAGGWELESFKSNPIALFNHHPDFIVGRWHRLRIEGNQLRGHLELAPKGTSPRINEIRKLVEAGILKAVSVGFRPLDHSPLNPKDPWSGQRFHKQELVETSLVAVPANPNALAVAKSLNVSPATIDLVFAKPGRTDGVTRRGFTGKPAATHHSSKDKPMTGMLGQRIPDSEQRLVRYRDDLTEHLGKIVDETASPEDMQKTKDLTAKVAQEELLLDTLKAAEARLVKHQMIEPDGDDKKPNGNGHDTSRALVVRNSPSGKAWAAPEKKITPLDYLWRSLTCQLKHHTEQQKRPILEIVKEEYGEDERTRGVMAMITRAASAPATIPQAGWAAELVTQVWMDFIDALLPHSVYPAVASRGSQFTFGRNGVINLPMRLGTPSLGGSFVGEGAPIPVRQGQFATVQLTPKKMAVISTFTRELSEHSTPAIEGLIREAILRDTGVALDSVLLDANPATVIRPAGLRLGATVVPPTAAGTAPVMAMLGDLKALWGALQAITNDNIRSPVFITTPQLKKSASLVYTTTGDTPFREEVNGGSLDGVPIVSSTVVPANTVMMLDAADFASVTEAAPRFDVSDQAVLHMEDTTPLAIASGSPGTVASPTRSLWQTDTIGVRMIMQANWIYRRAGMVATLTSPTWA